MIGLLGATDSCGLIQSSDLWDRFKWFAKSKSLYAVAATCVLAAFAAFCAAAR